MEIIVKHVIEASPQIEALLEKLAAGVSTAEVAATEEKKKRTRKSKAAPAASASDETLAPVAEEEAAPEQKGNTVMLHAEAPAPVEEKADAPDATYSVEDVRLAAQQTYQEWYSRSKAGETGAEEKRAAVAGLLGKYQVSDIGELGDNLNAFAEDLKQFGAKL